MPMTEMPTRAKTSLTPSLISECIKEGHGVCVLDPDRQVAERLIRALLRDEISFSVTYHDKERGGLK